MPRMSLTTSHFKTWWAWLLAGSPELLCIPSTLCHKMCRARLGGRGLEEREPLGQKYGLGGSVKDRDEDLRLELPGLVRESTRLLSNARHTCQNPELPIWDGFNEESCSPVTNLILAPSQNTCALLLLSVLSCKFSFVLHVPACASYHIALNSVSLFSIPPVLNYVLVLSFFS